MGDEYSLASIRHNDVDAGIIKKSRWNLAYLQALSAYNLNNDCIGTYLISLRVLPTDMVYIPACFLLLCAMSSYVLSSSSACYFLSQELITLEGMLCISAQTCRWIVDLSNMLTMTRWAE